MINTYFESIVIIILAYKTRQALPGRPGRPEKTTGRQARPSKLDNRHRQAWEAVGL